MAGSVTERFLAKRNQDGSYSIALTARQIAAGAWVDFYDDESGTGYQRKETLRERRGREIEGYFARCANESVTPRLFEMTANARAADESTVTVQFDALDENDQLGLLEVTAASPRWMCMIDGGTRLLGIQRAVESEVISSDTSFDVRLFAQLSIAEEIALFLLINEKQKRVRTDLGVRVVQQLFDDHKLSDSERKTLGTVVPDTDTWRYDASRIAGRLNSDADSSWQGLIQMPGDTATKPIKLQAFWTSLKPLLDDADMRLRLQSAADAAKKEKTEFTLMVLKNFWGAVAEVNPDARDEPRTNVLWGSIGVNGCHQALAEIMKTIFAGRTQDLRKERFVEMLLESEIADYDYWFSKAGSKRADYPKEKGDATTMTGGSGYSRLGDSLVQEWRAALYAADESQAVLV